MKKKNKIILIIISSIVALLFSMPLIDCYRVNYNKHPIFAFYTVNVSSFDVVVNEDGSTKNETPKSSTIYNGLGYSIHVCDYCKKRVTFLPLGMSPNYSDNI